MLNGEPRHPATKSVQSIRPVGQQRLDARDELKQQQQQQQADDDERSCSVITACDDVLSPPVDTQVSQYIGLSSFSRLSDSKRGFV